MQHTFDVVVAADKRLGIGKDGKLPWNLPKDMAYFKRVTTHVSNPSNRNAVIMGRKTWESIPPRFRPLDKRLNVVLTRLANLELPTGVLVANSLDEALELVQTDLIETTFVIGGGEIFRDAVHHPACRLLYLTEIEHDFDCNIFLPDYRQDFIRCDDEQPALHSENGIEYQFSKFIHKSKARTGQNDCVGVAR